ncbi:glycerate kinase type-2 family protein [Zavarzinia compransoris]|uniref:Glycerate kinase n=1 Tax=Zavarzinia compransoris TaxID=1264899 RepID=A0A317DVN4_9PROT|nr:glycerate kinase [Zavarzinia compransoris]PWR18757.1 glycerate kinase [Zavarzinia compransoris]TDP48740.1 hydroxypyruvate reductase [Zavarzinia compransoris]
MADLCDRLLATVLAAADVGAATLRHLPPVPKGRTVAVGAGKAAAAMAAALDRAWTGPLSGLVITRHGHGLPAGRIEVVEAGHPLPDDQGPRAAARILDLVRGLGPDDLVIALVSGGGSALMALPAPGLTLADKQAVTRALLRAGTPIGEINVVRKHLSAIKGGRLALAAAPAPLAALLVSDVPGDDPATIASGPTVPDPSTLAEARAIVERWRLDVPAAVAAHLRAPAAETPKPGDPRLARQGATVILRPADVLAAAEAAARAADRTVLNLGDRVEGEARRIGAEHARLALANRDRGPLAILSGGELTVTIAGDGGAGGPNKEYLLGLALGLGGAPGIRALAVDTDGIDGTSPDAGARIDPTTLARARALGLDAAALLAANRSRTFFEALGDLVVTGPTRTNVNDFRAIIVDGDLG